MLALSGPNTAGRALGDCPECAQSCLRPSQKADIRHTTREDAFRFDQIEQFTSAPSKPNRSPGRNFRTLLVPSASPLPRIALREADTPAGLGTHVAALSYSLPTTVRR